MISHAHQMSYADMLEDSQLDARIHEKELLDRGIQLMIESDQEPYHIGKRAEAIYFNSTLWSALLEDLASPENQYSEELRAGLISIGIYIMKALASIRSDREERFAAVVDISKTVSEGLKVE